jgi:hypothetical protein
MLLLMPVSSLLLFVCDEGHEGPRACVFVVGVVPRSSLSRSSRSLAENKHAPLSLSLLLTEPTITSELQI